MSVKMVNHKPLGACISQRTTKAWKELSESTSLELWKTIKGLQQPEERPQIQDKKIL